MSVVYSNNRRRGLVRRVTISATRGLVRNSKGTNDKRERSNWIGASVVEGSKIERIKGVIEERKDGVPIK